ncbi:MAG: hypothetical protein ACOYO1_04090 [Bacteroidales bacterium]
MEDIKNYTIKLDNNAQLLSLLSNNVEISNKVTRFHSAIEKLKSKQIKSEELHSILIMDISKIEKDKNNKRIELEKTLLPLIRIMQVFAYDKKKTNLQKKLEYLTLDYIQKCSDIELIKIAKKIWLIVDKNAGYSLIFNSKGNSALNKDSIKKINKFDKEYGLNPGLIKNIEKTNLNFIESLFIYQKEIKAKGKVAKKIKNILKQTEDLFSNKIDQFVKMLEIDNPGFSKDYYLLRENKPKSKIKETPEKKPIRQVRTNKENKNTQKDIEQSNESTQKPKATKTNKV